MSLNLFNTLMFFSLPLLPQSCDALIVNNITNFIKITLDIENSQYNTSLDYLKFTLKLTMFLTTSSLHSTTKPRSLSPSNLALSPLSNIYFIVSPA